MARKLFFVDTALSDMLDEGGAKYRAILARKAVNAIQINTQLGFLPYPSGTTPAELAPEAAYDNRIKIVTKAPHVITETPGGTSKWLVPSSSADLKRKNEQVSTERDELAQKLRKVESLYGRPEWMSRIVHEKLALCMHPLR